MSKTKKLAIAGILVAIGVSLSAFSIPVGAARVFPIQHMINVIAGVLLGPVYAITMALATSIIRNILGTGTLLAFPGSMFGALFAGYAAILARRVNRSEQRALVFACGGELFGTGILGALAAYPIAALLMGREVALFGFVIPFSISSLGGAVFAFIILLALKRTGVLQAAGVGAS